MRTQKQDQRQRHQQRLERKRQHRSRHTHQDINLSILIAGFCFAVTAGSLYFGITDGWDSIIPGKGGGMSAQTAMIAATVLDACAIIVIYFFHKKVRPKN